MAAKPSSPDSGADGAASARSGGGWMPMLLAILLAPAITWAVAQYVLLPQLQASLDPEHVAAKPVVAGESSDGGAHGGGHGEAAAPGAAGFKMENVVVNLAGTMGTRYLKTSFLITGEHPELIGKFDAAKPQVGDVTLAVLSGLTLADLEEPGSKNIIRERLVDAYNQIFGERVAEQLYFSEFVVQ